MVSKFQNLLRVYDQDSVDRLWVQSNRCGAAAIDAMRHADLVTTRAPNDPTQPIQF
jgi:hypothetical protein